MEEEKQKDAISVASLVEAALIDDERIIKAFNPTLTIEERFDKLDLEKLLQAMFPAPEGVKNHFPSWVEVCQLSQSPGGALHTADNSFVQFTTSLNAPTNNVYECGPIRVGLTQKQRLIVQNYNDYLKSDTSGKFLNPGRVMYDTFARFAPTISSGHILPDYRNLLTGPLMRGFIDRNLAIRHYGICFAPLKDYDARNLDIHDQAGNMAQYTHEQCFELFVNYADLNYLETYLKMLPPSVDVQNGYNLQPNNRPIVVWYVQNGAGLDYLTLHDVDVTAQQGVSNLYLSSELAWYPQYDINYFYLFASQALEFRFRTGGNVPNDLYVPKQDAYSFYLTMHTQEGYPAQFTRVNSYDRNQLIEMMHALRAAFQQRYMEMFYGSVLGNGRFFSPLINENVRIALNFDFRTTWVPYELIELFWMFTFKYADVKPIKTLYVSTSTAQLAIRTMEVPVNVLTPSFVFSTTDLADFALQDFTHKIQNQANQVYYWEGVDTAGFNYGFAPLYLRYVDFPAGYPMTGHRIINTRYTPINLLLHSSTSFQFFGEQGATPTRF